MKIDEKLIFKNQEFANVLMKDGVVKIPFLNSEELELLKSFYVESENDSVPQREFDGIHMTIWNSDLAYKVKIKESIEKIINLAFQRNFRSFRTLGHQFIVKKGGNETTFPIHQDWSIVDESVFFSLNIWIPLQNVDVNNGAMWILKGSHKIDRKIRGAGLLFPDYNSLFEDIRPYLTTFNMVSGEALIFYHSSIHGSPYNSNKTPRTVAQVSLVPMNAPLQIYFQKSKEDPLEVHHPSDDFGLQYDNIRVDSTIKPPSDNPAQIIKGYNSFAQSQSAILSLLKDFTAR